MKITGVRLRSNSPAGESAIVEVRVGRKWYKVLRSDDWKYLPHPACVEVRREDLVKRLPDELVEDVVGVCEGCGQRAELHQKTKGSMAKCLACLEWPAL